MDLETFERVQERLKRGGTVPARPDLDADFPLRGFVLCGDCQHPLTANWSKSKTGKRHAYYSCFHKGCPSARKSIRRADIEGAFEDALEQISPSETMFEMLRAMFSDAWPQQRELAQFAAQSARARLVEVERKIASLIERVLDVSQPTVIAAFESKIAVLEREKLILEEKAQAEARPNRPFDEMFELSIRFLANPSYLWESDDLEHKRTVLKVAFSDKLIYCRNQGLRTPKTRLVFNVLERLRSGDSQMADREGFEPSVPDYRYGGLAIHWFKPLTHLSYRRRRA